MTSHVTAGRVTDRIPQTRRTGWPDTAHLAIYGTPPGWPDTAHLAIYGTPPGWPDTAHLAIYGTPPGWPDTAHLAIYGTPPDFLTLLRDEGLRRGPRGI
jgi:hypothetical protein